MRPLAVSQHRKDGTYMSYNGRRHIIKVGWREGLHCLQFCSRDLFRNEPVVYGGREMACNILQ